MATLDSQRMPTCAVEVAHRIWWVGATLEGDDFQCHAYLVEAGTESVLIDPGSTLTIDATLGKIAEVVPLDWLRTIVLHHSDPDCADSLHRLDSLITRPDARVVTEWRSALLLRHLAVSLPFVAIEDLGWTIPLDDERALQFLLTPYLHFPGAFVSYETSTNSLFSADLFGGFNRGGKLWSDSSADFEDLRRFHEHYMPSNEILVAGLATIRGRFPEAERVLPQHGYLIPAPLIDSMFDQLRVLDCGVMLASRSDTHLSHLLDVVGAVRRIGALLARNTLDDEVVHAVAAELGVILSVESMWLDVRHPDGTIRFDAATGYLGRRLTDDGRAVHASDRLLEFDVPAEAGQPSSGIGILTTAPVELASEVLQILQGLMVPIRHLAMHSLEKWQAAEATQQLEAEATHDPLTGLANRRYYSADDTTELPRGVLMIDIDHFKTVNDDHGHAAGDEILCLVADTVTHCAREDDIVLRYGGEEFLVVTRPFVDEAHAVTATRALAERIRSCIEAVDASAATPGRRLTASVGGTVQTTTEPLEAALERADDALYRAKDAGRNRTDFEPPPAG